MWYLCDAIDIVQPVRVHHTNEALCSEAWAVRPLLELAGVNKPARVQIVTEVGLLCSSIGYAVAYSRFKSVFITCMA